MRIRPTVRLLIVDDQERILLLKIEDAVALDPQRPDLTIYWATPGGGVEAGETFEEAGLRELWEETGMREEELGPCVWSRKRTLHFPDETVLFDERYYLLRVKTAEVVLTNMLPQEQAVYRAHRWWTLEDIETSPEVFLPHGLAELLRPLLAGQIPSVPRILEEGGTSS
jgi:ADP-ribose pyrophosphatase YjhB (NUDIX family)